MRQKWASVLVSALVLAGNCSALAIEEAGLSKRAQSLHLLRRLTYGPTPGDIQRLEKQGFEKFIQDQLNPESLKLDPQLAESLAHNEALTLTPGQLFIKYGPPAVAMMKDQPLSGGSAAAGGGKNGEKKETQKLRQAYFRKVYMDVASARLERALYSPRQLQELMVEFWYDHFNISMDKGLDHLWAGSFEEKAIRPHSMGKFRDLLGATAHHAAMLFYLDNWQNSATATQAKNPKSKFKGLNENYARELMELHTLGVDGGYSQKDVVELARILTGLGLINRGSGAGFKRMQAGGKRAFMQGAEQAADNPDGSKFDAKRHDFGDKMLLGHTIKGSGEQEIEQALDILAKHPSTARRISYKLAQFFVADSPPSSLVDKLAKVYSSSDGDIRSMLDTLFHSSEFSDSKNIGSKFKSPYRYLISSLRACDANVSEPKLLVQFLKQQGQPMYQCLTPDGYKNTQSAWLNSHALLSRINFATSLGLSKAPGIRTNVKANELASIVAPTLSANTQNTLQDAPAQLQTVLLVGSPEFMMY